jgi:hypothetical protein
MSTKQDTVNNIKSFISNIANKDYKQANAFLHKTVENKLKERVQQSLATKN